MPSGFLDLIENGSAWWGSGVSGGETGAGVILGLRAFLKRPHRNKTMMAEGQKGQDLTIQTELKTVD